MRPRKGTDCGKIHHGCVYEVKTCVCGGELKKLRLKDAFPHSLTLESLLVELESETNYHLVLNFSVEEGCCWV